MRQLLSLAIAVIIASCSSSEAVDTSVPVDSDPVEVASQWIEAVGRGDDTALAELVEPNGLAVIAGVETNLRSAEFVTLVESGMSAELSDQYWSQFRDDFAAFSGTAIADLEVGEEQSIAAPEFTAVTLIGGEGSGSLIMRRTEAGWQVDFPATIGPSLIGPLGEYLTSATTGSNAAPIAVVYRDFVAPGLEAALALDPSNTRLRFEAEYIRQLSESTAASP